MAGSIDSFNKQIFYAKRGRVGNESWNTVSKREMKKALKELTPKQGEVEENWELLEGEETQLQELAELVYGDFTPASAWAAC